MKALSIIGTIVLFTLASFSFFEGVSTLLRAKSAFHQIYGSIYLVCGAIFLAGGIINLSISRLFPQNAILPPVPVKPTVIPENDTEKQKDAPKFSPST